MSLLGRLPNPNKLSQARRTWPSLESIERMLGWLVSRQTPVLREEDYSDQIATGADVPSGVEEAQLPSQPKAAPLAVATDSTLQDESGIEPSDDDVQFAGFAGRCNKAADTCYAFWAGGSLAVSDILLTHGLAYSC